MVLCNWAFSDGGPAAHCAQYTVQLLGSVGGLKYPGRAMVAERFKVSVYDSNGDSALLGSLADSLRCWLCRAVNGF